MEGLPRKKLRGDREIKQNTLKVQRAEEYDRQDRNRKYYSEEIGCFSTNSENKYFDDDHQKKYLCLPDNLENLKMDLSEGYDKYVGTYRDDENPYNKILKWIRDHKTEVRRHFRIGNSSNPSVDFVCHRSTLLAICSTIYEKDGEWVIHATKFGSVIYLCNVDTEQKRSMTATEQKQCSWGYKFEQYITSDTENSKPNTSAPVNVNEKFFVVMEGKLDNHRLLFSAETDAVDPQYTAESGKDSKSKFSYVEMKTSRILDDKKQKRNFCRFKVRKWYLQSYIAGVPRVVCGFRDDEGIVQKIEIYNVSDMPKMGKDKWTPAACLNFCSEFLNFVIECVVKDDPKVVYRFSCKCQKVITCGELSSEPFLPDWYIESVHI